MNARTHTYTQAILHHEEKVKAFIMRKWRKRSEKRLLTYQLEVSTAGVSIGFVMTVVVRQLQRSIERELCYMEFSLTGDPDCHGDRS